MDESAPTDDRDQAGAGSPRAAQHRVVTVPAVLTAAMASDPGRPRLTWYGADGERVELSARVLANWVVKTAHLLLEELLDDPDEPAAVLVDVPPHWRSVVWVLAAWTVGAEVVNGSDPGAADAPVAVTTDPSATPAPSSGVPLVVMTLAALAFSSDAVPAGAIDYNAVVAGFGDEMPRDGRPLGRSVAVPATEDGGPARVLVATDVSGGAAGPVAAADAVLAALAGDGSAVLTGPGAPDAARLVGTERVTSTVR